MSSSLFSPSDGGSANRIGARTVLDIGDEKRAWHADGDVEETGRRKCREVEERVGTNLVGAADKFRQRDGEAEGGALENEDRKAKQGGHSHAQPLWQDHIAQSV